ncbi:MAG: alpha/beta hydrolase [Deltaproteobacteria bacterium]
MLTARFLRALSLSSLLFFAACGGSDAPVPSGEISWIEIEANGFVFDARAAGPEDGEPVILLHGFPETSAEWKHQLSALGLAGYRAIAPDQRGYSAGARPAEESAYFMPNLGSDVTAIADALGFERFHLVGHDWGAAVAWFVGVASPERLLSLNPISVPHLDAFSKTRNDPESCQYSASGYIDFFIQPNSHEVMLADDARFLRGIWDVSAAANVDEYLEVFQEPGALKAALDWYRANSLSGPSPEIGPVTVRTMYIWSTGDTALCEDGAYLTGDYVDAPYRFEILEGVNHWVPEAAAEQVSALLLSHLAE